MVFAEYETVMSSAYGAAVRLACDIWALNKVARSLGVYFALSFVSLIPHPCAMLFCTETHYSFFHSVNSTAKCSLSLAN